jgi:hypothetical protein
MSNLLHNDSSLYHQLLDLIELLSGVEVDYRHLLQLRQMFLNQDNGEVQQVSMG